METRIEAAQDQIACRAGRSPFRTFYSSTHFALALLAFVVFLIFPSAQAAAATLTITTKTLPAGYVSSGYAQVLAATGGSGKGYTWSVAAGTLPKGITLTAASGLLGGTPTVAGSSALTFQVKDSAGATASAKLTLVIDPALAITTKTLPIGYVSVAYSAKLAATGGTSTGYVWTVKSGSLPTGVTLSTAGVLAGKPAVANSFAVTLQVRDSLSHVAAVAFTIVVHPVLAIKPPSVPEAFVATAYSLAFTATGGSGTGYAWSVTSGTIPNGLVLSSTTGTISGKPTAPGSSAVTLQVKDSLGNIAKASFTIVVAPQLVIATVGPLPIGQVNVNYNFTFTAKGGSGTGYTWSTKSVLPGSYVLSKAGLLYGLAPVADTVVITINVTDSAKNTAAAQYTLMVNAAVTQCATDNQASALSELHGVYTFNLTRRNLTTGQVFYSVGSFDANGPGTISGGVMDSNGPGFAAATQSTFTGTYIVGSDGRGRMDLTYAGSPALKQSFCFALDSYQVIKTPPPSPPQPTPAPTYGPATHAFVLEDDGSNVTASGELFQQLVNPANSIMQGSFAFGLRGRNHFPTLLPNGPDPRVAFAAYLNLDGVGTITGGEMDEVISNEVTGVPFPPTYTPKQSLKGTYSIPTPATGYPTGRGTMTLTNNGVDFAQFVFYPYGGVAASNPGTVNLAAGVVVLEVSAANNTTTPVHPAWAGSGARRTASTFSTASLNGWSVTSQSFVDNPGTTDESEGVEIDLDHWDSAGNFTYTGDRNATSLKTAVSGQGKYTVDANGRFAVMVNGLCAPCGYLIGPNQGFGIYDSDSVNQVMLEKQVLYNNGPFQLLSVLGAYSFGSRGFSFAPQQTTSGETVTRGDGNFTGHVDTNTMGKTDVDVVQTALMTTTTTTGATGRFVYQPTNTTYPYALYVIDPANAVAIPLGGSANETDPLLRFIHQ